MQQVGSRVVQDAGGIIDRLSGTQLGTITIVCLAAFGLVGWVVWVMRPRQRSS